MGFQLGSGRDISLFRKLNRELINTMIRQEIGLYKLSLEDSPVNSYGESPNKSYYQPILLNALVKWEDQKTLDTEIGQDRDQQINVAFLRDDLVEANIYPETGDIILWREEYYEITNDNESKFLFGKDDNYPLSIDTSNYGSSWSINCDCTLIRVDKLNIIPVRQ